MKPDNKKQDGSLAAYRAKRDFRRTSEPLGSLYGNSDSKQTFVVQKHRARRLHFDFRLELDGVLKSWAIPKGPSMDPSEKRLAVRTEDHPIEYGLFEGIIPEGEYGAGEVMLWDRGTWRAHNDPRKGLELGELKFDLEGQRLRGAFVLVKLRDGAPGHENWLLIKERDEKAAQNSSVDRAWRRSIKTGRNFEEIARNGHEWSLGSAKPRNDRKDKRRVSALPEFHKPQLATLAKAAPAGALWAHEVKFDGYRLLAAVGGGRAKLYTRSGLDWTIKFHALAQAAAQLEVNSALLDGEAVVLDEEGRSSFAQLQRSLKTGERTIRYYLFDVLELEGNDLTGTPLVDRKARLRNLLSNCPDSLIFSDHIIGNGEQVLAEACRLGLEGIISKRIDSLYQSRRSLSWLKIKCTCRDEFVVGGWRPSTKAGRSFSSLLLGEFEDGELHYRGRVGAGFDADTLDEVSRKLLRLSCDQNPFVDVPQAISRVARWVEPRLVVEVAYSERTEDGYLRQPVFVGLREDKKAQEVRRPAILRGHRTNRKTHARLHPPDMTHPEKIMYQEEGLTKADIAAHWRRVAPFALPHIRERPLSLVRCPDGVSGECFFQRRHSKSMPREILPIEIPDKKARAEKLVAISTVEGLDAAAQIAALELHLWGAHTATIDTPDRLVFDLDPDPSVSFEEVKRASTDLRDLLDAARLKSFVMLSGGKGLHVVVPLKPLLGWAEVGAFAKGLAMRLAADDPRRFTAVMTKARRKNKIYIDYLRNERGASAIAPYSPRARQISSVATPLEWGELQNADRSDAYTLEGMGRRVRVLAGRDPWAGYFEILQEIPLAALKMFSA